MWFGVFVGGYWFSVVVFACAFIFGYYICWLGGFVVCVGLGLLVVWLWFLVWFICIVILRLLCLWVCFVLFVCYCFGMGLLYLLFDV